MIAIIIQARIGSTRLPKKVLVEIEKEPMLWHVIQRAKKVRDIDRVIVATTDKKEDKKIIEIADKAGVESFTGSESDVLDRYYWAAKKYGVNIIVRITSDCPLIDPEIVSKAVEFFVKNNFDYVSNIHPSTFPDGMDVEVFSFKSLEKNWQEAKLKSEREHVTPYIWKNSKKFKIGNLFYGKKDISRMRLTLDEKKDLILIRKIYKELYNKNNFFNLEAILKLFERKPKLLEINHDIKTNQGYLKSLEND